MCICLCFVVFSLLCIFVGILVVSIFVGIFCFFSISVFVVMNVFLCMIDRFSSVVFMLIR